MSAHEAVRAIRDEQNIAPLFHTATEAIRFALTVTGRPERPAMNRVADGPIGPSKGLGGLDGAAQAGIINSHMKKAGNVGYSVLVARVAPRSMICQCRSPCCKGSFENWDWLNAIDYLAQQASKQQCNCKASFNLRKVLVRKLFGDARPIIKIADELDLDRHTVGAHYARIQRWVAGQPAHGNEPEIEGVEVRAWRIVDASLREARIIE